MEADEYEIVALAQIERTRIGVMEDAGQAPGRQLLPEAFKEPVRIIQSFDVQLMRQEMHGYSSRPAHELQPRRSHRPRRFAPEIEVGLVVHIEIIEFGHAVEIDIDVISTHGRHANNICPMDGRLQPNSSRASIIDISDICLDGFRGSGDIGGVDMRTIGSCRIAALIAVVGMALAIPAFPSPTTGPTRVLVVGTIHDGHTKKSELFLPGPYRYPGDLYAPDAICVEIRPVDFRRKSYLTEMMMATIFGLDHGLKVYPIDSWGRGQYRRPGRAGSLYEDARVPGQTQGGGRPCRREPGDAGFR